MHMIPADDYVWDQLLGIKEGNIIQIEGQLVLVDSLDGWSWRSSMSREDTGNGACEVIFVERVRVLQ